MPYSPDINIQSRIAQPMGSSSSFTEDTSISLPGVSISSVAWSDYNGDGKPDLLLTGYSSSGFISKLYKNTGYGFIQDTSISLPGVSQGSVAWGDYTGDGKPDFLLTGDTTGTYKGISKLYKNTGYGFSEDTSVSLPGVSVGSVAWADYNGDGKPDLLLTGYSSSGFISKLYKNTGYGFIQDTSISLPGVSQGSVAWGDYTGDGKPDFLLTGGISKLYKNTGSGFSEDTSVSLPDVYGGSVAWADYNGDGKQDLLLTGESSSGRISKLYKNTGSGFSEDTSISLPAVYRSSVAWADYNGDGKPDFLLTGFDNSGNKISKLYKNTGSGFSEDTSISLPGVSVGSVAWSDYNGDGKKDLLLTGWTDSVSYISKLYKNTTTPPDTTPPADSSFSPVDNATGIAVGADLVVNFSEAIKKGTGDIVIKKLSDNSVVETIAVTNSNVTVSGSQLTINPTNDLAQTTDYYVEIVNGAIKDIAGNNYAGMTGNSTWNFTTADTTPPAASSFSPVDNTTGIAVGADLVANFSEAIQKGTGDIVIKKLSDNSVVETIAVTNSNVTVSGSQLTINPTNDLAQGINYYVEIANGAIKDIAGNNYAGITGNSVWNFTTVAPSDTTPPAASSFSPVDNATGIAVGANLVVNFSEAIKKGTGDIVIKKVSDNSVVETIAVTAANITVSGSKLTINPTANLATGTDYYIGIANGAIKDTAGNNYAGITGNSIWNFKTQGTPVINGTANNDILTGTANPETINGLGGNDKLSGLGGNDSLNGGAGNDTLNGGAGSDQLKGNAGNDIYIVGTGDIVTELAAQGTDLVQSSISYTLPANVEKLTLTGTTAINGTGNGLANTINGNSAKNTLNGSTGNDLILGNGGVDKLLGGAGNDSLNGGAGNDTLTGGIGVDKFIYNTNAAFTTSAVGVDTITDFIIAQGDKIVLDKTTFPKISSVAGTGFSINSEFAKVNSDALAATSAADIVYNSATGGLFYNQNGTVAGFGTGAKFLTLTNKPVLTENQFVIQA